MQQDYMVEHSHVLATYLFPHVKPVMSSHYIHVVLSSLVA